MKHFRFRPRSALILGVVLVCSLGLFYSARLEGPAEGASSLTGLVSLTAVAQESVPYDAALSDRKPMFLEFYANWCSTCRSLAPLLQRLHARYGEQVNFVMLNVDDPRWTEVIEQYQVRGVPQLFLLNVEGEWVKTLAGQVPEVQLVEAFEQLLS